MQNKRKLAFIPLVALMGLAGCDIVAEPADYNDVIVTIDNDITKSKAVYNNISSIVEDAYHDGSMASDVLEKVLYQYAVTIIGRYNTIIDGYNRDSTEPEITLKAAVLDASKTGTTDFPVANSFISNHSSYWTTDKDGNRIDDTGKKVDKTAPASGTELVRLKERWEIIENLIAEKMYDKVTGGSYSDRGIFYESRFVESLRNSGKKVIVEGGTYNDGEIISPSVEPEETFKKELLNRGNYQSKYGLNDQEDPNTKIRYIEDEIIPDIYNSLFVSQYLVDKKYNVLGSSYARKVNIFSITTKSDFPKEDDYLIDSLIDKINALPASTSDKRVSTTLDDFKAYSNAWNGIFNEGEDSIKILDDIREINPSLFVKDYENKPDPDDKDTWTDPYYEGTEYGEMVKKYHELDALNDPDKYRTVDSSVVNDFTNSGAYVKEVGRSIKTNDIAIKDQTQTGWYISNGGLSSLPESIRSRLFSFSVATAFKEDTAEQDASDRLQCTKEGEETYSWKYEVPEDESSYLARINGVYYLKNSSASQGSDRKNDILFYDTSSSTYYVIQVLEAVRSAKIAKEDNPGVTYDAKKKEEVINSICKCVAGTESYTSLAKKYFLEQMSIQYHDTTVYEYFLANYPELFED